MTFFRLIQQVVTGLLFLTMILIPLESLAKSQGGIVDRFGYPVGKTYQYVRPNRATAPRLVSGGKLVLKRAAWQALASLKRQAAKRGIVLSVVSGYRSPAAQRQVLKKYGSHRAEKPGFSEHNLGTAVDFRGVPFRSRTFLWLLTGGINAGWVPTYYYKRNSRFMREPWHWRYVGKTAARQFYLTWRPQIERDKKLLQKTLKKGRKN
jgi:D-alanyl-D-alanine carboxypeptidase